MKAQRNRERPKQAISRAKRIAVLLAALLVSGFAASRAAAELTPFTSNGSLGAFSPTADVLFDTDNGTYTVGSDVFSGGATQLIGANLDRTFMFGAEVAVYNFSSFAIPQGVTVKAVGARPLIISSVGDISVSGTIDLSGAAGAAGTGGGTGGGGGGGALGLFTNDSLIHITSSGVVDVRGGTSPVGTTGGSSASGGGGGQAGAGGSAGGRGGDVAGAGNGGGGSNGVWYGGGGGGGGGGGTIGGVPGQGGLPGTGRGLGTTAGAAGANAAGAAGGLGGVGGTATVGWDGGSGGSGGNFPGGGGVPGVSGSFTSGAGGGGGGADGTVASGAGGGGGGGAGNGAITVTVDVEVPIGDKGKVNGKATIGGKAGDGAAGGGGGVVGGAKNSTFMNDGIINVSGGLSSDPESGVSRGGDGYVYLMAESFAGSGSIVGGDLVVDNVGIADAGDIFFTGGGGGGGGGGPGETLPIPEPSTYLMMALGLAGLVCFARRRR